MFVSFCLDFRGFFISEALIMNVGLILLKIALQILASKKEKMQAALNKAKVKANLTKSTTDDYRVLVLQFMLDNIPNK